MRPEAALECIRMLAETSDAITFGLHALERMDERDISDIDVLRVLRRGRIKGSIRAGRRDGEWIVKIVDRIRGSREAGVVTAVIGVSKLFIITVEWEDIG
jgi:hypothetical protein